MLYIRTDINDVIATGHVMRCLSIAYAAKEIGEDVTFILADVQGKNYIENSGYQTMILNTQWNDMDAEIPILIELIEKENITTLLIDSYQVTDNYFRELSYYVDIIYIDDFAKDVYAVKMLICYMSHWEKLQHKKRYPDTKLLLGLQYIPLRNVYLNVEKKEIKDTVETVLLLSGGTDPHNVLPWFVEVLKENNFKEIIVICGRFNTNADILKEKYKDDHSIRVLKSVDNIEQYMKKADLAISAGGTTLYELCACGVPTVSYSFVDNQIENVHGFADGGIIEYIGDVRYDDIFHNLKEILNQYCSNVELRREKSRKMQKMVDGKGASRIVAEWMELIKE